MPFSSVSHQSLALASTALFLMFGSSLCKADGNTTLVHGTVVITEADGSQSVIPGAAVTLRSGDFVRQTTADDHGAYSFGGLRAGTYDVRASAPGLTGSASVELPAGQSIEVVLYVTLQEEKESVTVTGSTEPTPLTEPEQQNEIGRSTILNGPTKDDRADALLPLIPGVVRGPDGLIKINGSRSSQSGALINSASIVDPVTGNAAMSLPIDVVESVTVLSNPYDPEYGWLSGAVSKVETTTSNFDNFHATVQNLLVRPRKRDGDFIGIESATPRATVTGPVIAHKIAFTESFEYRFIRTPVSSLPQLQRDMKFEGFTWFNQLDANLSSRQTMTASFTLYPQKLNYLGLNTFMPQPSSPDLHQRGFMAAVQDRLVIASDSVLISQFSFKRFDVDVTPNSSGPYDLLIETTTGGFFDRQARQSEHAEWHELYQSEAHNFLGTHQLKAGFEYAHDTYDGRVTLTPVTIDGVSNLPIEQIRFGLPSRFNIDQNQIAWFLGDKWQPIQRLTVDLGLRFDRDSITDSLNVAPRAGFALMLTKDEKTVLKGGAGLFYNRVPLNVVSFPLLPDRTISSLSAGGEVVPSETLVNTVTGGLKNPRSVGSNVEVDRQLTSALVVSAGFQERNTVRDFVLDPKPNLGLLDLSNDGRNFYRAFQFQGQYKWRRGTLNASYVRSKAFGNLNDFEQFFGNNAVPVIDADAQGRLPFDAPNRFLAWGQWSAPFKLTIMPVLDVHTGFPYSLIDEARTFVGERDSQRFPQFSSLDLQVTRSVALPFRDKFKSRIGFSVFNLLNRFNPRDVQNDLDSQRFGAMFNGVGRIWRGKFVLEF